MILIKDRQFLELKSSKKLLKVCRNSIMEIVLLSNWLCIEAQSCKETGDISNIFSTIIGTVLGILIGAFISWLVYNRQEKTANKQEQVLEKIHEFEEKHDRILKNILKLDEKIDSLLENKSH